MQKLLNSCILSRVFILLIIFSILTACDPTPRHITIKGNLTNLPDGKMILSAINPDFTKLDSVPITKGIFEFRLPAKDFPEPVLVSLTYIGPDGVRKGLVSRKEYNGMMNPKETSASNEFMLEDGIEINGPVSESKNRYFTSIYVERPIRTGKQNRVRYSDTIDFYNLTNIAALQEQISQHPYSYHYLYSIERRMRTASKAAFYALFNRFDPEVQNSKTGKSMKEYIENRDRYKLSHQTTLPDTNGTLRPILRRNAQLTVVILWASWCRPCHAEIPTLKRLHEKFSGNPSFQMVSISIDDDRDQWIKAIRMVKMPWSQLLITPEALNYAKELFGYNNQIPLTLFLDREGNVIQRFLGFDKKKEKAFEALIDQHLGAPALTKF